ncbi:Murein hydrolase activator EnvC precursor [compost metagenome]
MGAPIKASKSGKVVTASYISGYGNTVILDHGSGIQTLYAHSSSLAVSVGQTVSQGQVIAYVGSTGNSTGPHLHFEIRVNGQHQNPTNYLSF